MEFVVLFLFKDVFYVFAYRPSCECLYLGCASPKRKFCINAALMYIKVISLAVHHSKQMTTVMRCSILRVNVNYIDRLGIHSFI